ncbi:hypothetical protein [Alteromonas sp. CYL-A6]|uniref:hypothetical protein n=1 Tax=Alteromonas nitratireducens TaxID=3390813 RepID=UPI0034BAF43E
MFNENESGIVWALKETSNGSIYNEFIAYAVQILGDESYKPFIENGIYDLGKIALGATFLSLPKFL